MASIYRVNILEDKLKELTDAALGIRGAVIVSIEGFVVAAHVPANVGSYESFTATDTPQVAAIAATLFALGEQTLSRLAQGKIERLLVEGKAGAIITYPINEDAVLAAMVVKEAKMGLALLATARTAGELADILEGAR